MPGVHFILNNALAVLCSWTIAELCVPDRRDPRRLLVVVTSFGVVTCGSLLLLALTLGFSNLRLTALLIVLGTVLGGLARNGRPLEVRTHSEHFSVATWRAKATVAIFIFGVTVWLSLLVRGSAFAWDDLMYHNAIVAQWVQDGSLTLGRFNFQSYFPLNTELFAVWFVLPFRDDAVINLTVLYWWLVASTSMLVIVRAYTEDWVPALCAVAIFSAARPALDALIGFGSGIGADLSGPAMMLAALAFSLPPKATAGTPSAVARRERVDISCAGVAAGFAVGCKVTFVPTALLLLAYWLLVRVRSHRMVELARTTAIFVVAALLSGGFWYLRDFILTGNPLYPAAVGPFAGPFDSFSQARTKIVTWIITQTISWQELRPAVKTALNWPPWLLILCLWGYWKAVGDAWRQRFLNHQGLLVASGVLALALHAITPFSATINRPDADFRIDDRFLIFSFAVGTTLWAALVGVRVGPRTVAVLCVAASWCGLVVRASEVWTGPLIAAGLATLGCVVCWRMLARLVAYARETRWAPPCAALVLVGVVGASHSFKQDATDANVFEWTLDPCREIGATWRALESLPAGSTIAAFMPEPIDYTRYYPLFGRRLQFHVAVLERDGSLRPPLHVAPHEQWWQDWDTRGAPLDPNTFMTNVRSHHVQFIVTSAEARRNYHPVQDQILAASHTNAVYRNSCSVIWQVAAAP